MVSKPNWIPVERLELEDAFAVNYSRLPLDPESFEEKSLAVQDFLKFDHDWTNPWTEIAYFSRRSALVVVVDRYELAITNRTVVK